MPVYTVEDSQTGKQVMFEWFDETPPTQADIAEVIGSAVASEPERVGELKAAPPVWKETVSRITRPILEFGGLTAGSLGGAPSGPVGAAVGAGLLYAAGSNAADVVDESLGMRQPVGVPARLMEAGKDVIEGAAMEAGGQALPVAAGVLGKKIGRGAAAIHGKLTGVGTEGTVQAFKSGLRGGKDSFAKALRGEITGEEVVATAHQALNSIKSNRGAAYREQLAGLSDKPIDIAPLKQHVDDLLSKYNIARVPAKVDPATGKVTAKAKLDLSRSAMWKKGDKDVREVIKILDGWGGQAGDDTAVGLDTLKRQLDDFYSESGKARSFVASLRKKVVDTITGAVPAYGEMTKGYAEATALIKDIEAGLMMRKQGMTGRIVPDQTLRRLISAMKDSHALRKELVDELGGGGRDITQQVAGHAMSSLTPRGLGGTGPALVGHAALGAIVSPKFWAILVASSPRVSAEFIRVMGKGAGLGKATGPTTMRAIMYLNKLREGGAEEPEPQLAP